MSKAFFEENRQRLTEVMQEDSMVILFSGKAPKKSADEKYPFTINRNFYYISGLREQDIMIILTKIEDKVTTTLFIKKRDAFLEKWVGKTISKEEAILQTGIQDVRETESFNQAIHLMVAGLQVDRLYFDLERDNFEADLTREQRYATLCKDKYPYVTIKNAYPILSKLRMIKAPFEIEQLRAAIDVTHQGVNALMKHAKSGMKEYALEAYFDFELKTRGTKDYAFKTIAASGANATVLHYEENNCEIPADSLILFDLGAQYEYYNADISRTLPSDGKFTERQKTFYNIVLKAQLEVIAAIKPGVTLMELNNIVKAIYLDELKALGMVETMEDVAKYYYHGVSHFLGLDTHDVGVKGAKLEPGMVITVEPGLYIEEEAIGIRIEDDVLVTVDGCDVLSQAIIKTVEEIESFMK